MAQRTAQVTAVTAGAALAAALVAALRRRLLGAGGPPPAGPDEGPDTGGVREPRVPTPSAGSAAAAVEPPSD